MSAQTPVISIIIPVYNKWELTRDCLVSLRDHTREYSFEVIVVDNASSDETAKELASFGKNLFGEAFTALVFSENRNFGPACNAGAQTAKAPLLFFLNNDTLLTPEWAPPLMEAMLSGCAPGAVGPLLLYPDDTVQHLGVTFAPQGVSHLYQGFPKDHPFVHKPRRLQFITGAALMVSKTLFLECGGFYEGYVNGFEDVDLCVQLGRRGAGMSCVPASVVYHLESQTPGRKAEERDNSALFYERCGAYAYIDAHHHAIRDGLSIAVNDLLGLSRYLSPEENARLSREAEGRDHAFCLELLRRNPLWKEGREAVAAALEQAGDIAEAVRLRVELSVITPTRQTFGELLRLATQTGNAPWAENLQGVVNAMEHYRADASFAHNKFQQVRKFFRHGSDSVLENLYTEKLRALKTGSS